MGCFALVAYNKATQIGPKFAVTFIANGATNAPLTFGRWLRRYVSKR